MFILFEQHLKDIIFFIFHYIKFSTEMLRARTKYQKFSYTKYYIHFSASSIIAIIERADSQHDHRIIFMTCFERKYYKMCCCVFRTQTFDVTFMMTKGLNGTRMIRNIDVSEQVPLHNSKSKKYFQSKVQ